jgi:hypothetical protein
MSIEAVPAELRTTDRWAFSDLRALYVNCTLKRSPERSHTQGLIDLSKRIMDANGVTFDEIRAVDYELAPGVWPDMREHGAERDDTGPPSTTVCRLPTSSCSARRSGSARSRRFPRA